MSTVIEKSPFRRERRQGQSLTEYGLILALVTVFCLVSLRLLGQNMGTMFDGMAKSISQVLAG